MSDETDDWYSPLKLKGFLLGICWAAICVESYNSVNETWLIITSAIPASWSFSFKVLPNGSVKKKLWGWVIY